MLPLNRILLAVAAVVVLSSANGQLKSIRHDEYTMRDGLSSNRVTTLLQDFKGFLWIGTEDGLNRFDGKTFESFHAGQQNLASSLSGDWITCLDSMEDYLLIGTNNGLCIYDLKKDVFNNNLISDNTCKAGSNSHIYRVWADRRKRVWLNTNGQLFLFDQHLKLIRRLTDDRSFSALKKQLIVTDAGCYGRDGEILLPTLSGILSMSEKNGFPQIDSILFPQPSQWVRLLSLSDQKIIGAPFGEGIVIYDRKSGVQRKIEIPVYDLNPVAENYSVKAFLRDRTGQYWAATGSGLLKFDPALLTKEKYVFGRRGNKENQVESSCYSLLEDKTGNIWVATDHGLKKISPNLAFFKKLSDLIPGYQSPFPYEPEQIIVDTKNRLWVGSWYNGLQVFDLQTKKQISIPVLQDQKFSSTVEIKEHFPGEFWIATFRGLYIYKEKEKRLVRPSFLPDSLRNAFTILSHKDRFGGFWISFVGKGILHYVPSTGEKNYYNYYRPDNAADYLPIRHATTLVEDGQGNIWMGHVWKTSPLVKWERSKNQLSTIADTGIRKAPFNAGIGDMYVDPHQNLWIATVDNGLVKYNLKDGNWKQFTKADGICSNNLTTIVSDSKGILWLGTYLGLSAFDTAKNFFQNFFDFDGLPDNLFLNGGYYNPTTGQIFVSQRNNVIYFKPDELTREGASYTPVIKKIKVENKTIDISSGRSFNYTQNHFDFEFTAVNLVDGHKNQYAYMLEGLDKEWVYCGGRTQISYSGIPPGSYTFKVKMAVAPNKLGAEIASYHFTIHPPFWRTGWFIALCISAVIALAYAFHRLHINRLLAMEKMRQRFSQDLHDDIGSTLSSINILARSSTSGSSSDQKETLLLQKIQQRSQKMLDAMDDLIWNTKPENDSLESLVVRMREYASEVLEAAGIHFIIQDPSAINNVKLNMTQKKNLYLIFKEAVNNLAKYSQTKKAFIYFKQHKTSIQMTIRDEGVGFANLNGKNRNGIENMKSRAMEMRGHLEIYSEKDEGTVVTVRVPV